MAITKCINSESKQFKPVLTDKLVLDAVPTVNSLNSVTSDAVARAIAGASGEVPQVTENDNGKILTATYDALGPAVSWEEAPSGIPDMTGKDGKILGAVDNDGTMEAKWINKPVSNVTTSDKQFVVGVNGTGLPITVDCANAHPVNRPVSLGTGRYMELVSGGTSFPSVIFPYDDMSSIPQGVDITITFVIPESIDTSSIAGIGFGTMTSTSYKSTGSLGLNTGNPSPTMPSAGVYNAGTYTTTFTIPSNYDISTDSGFALMFPGGGSPDGWSTFCGLIESAASTISCSISGSEVIGYTIKPSVIATPGSNASGKVLTVTDTQGNYGWQPVPKELPTTGVGNAGKVLTVSQYGSPTWVAPQTSTAGDGIDITSNEVSVKAGTGLEFDDILTPSGTTNLVSQDVSETYYDTYTVYSFAPLTSGLLSQMSSGLDVTLIGEFNASENTYAALYTLNSGLEVVNRLVLGNSTGVLNPGSVVTFDTNNINTAESNVTLSQVESNISNYRLGLLTKSGSSWICALWNIFNDTQAITSATTATCPEMITVQDALCVSNPVPAYDTTTDVGKVLTVTANGLAWVTPS